MLRRRRRGAGSATGSARRRRLGGTRRAPGSRRSTFRRPRGRRLPASPKVVRSVLRSASRRSSRPVSGLPRRKSRVDHALDRSLPRRAGGPRRTPIAPPTSMSTKTAAQICGRARLSATGVPPRIAGRLRSGVGQHRPEEERGDRGQRRGDARAREPGADEHAVLEGAGRRDAPGDDAAGARSRPAATWRQGTSAGLQRDPLQLPHGDEGERLDAERYHHPFRLELVSDRHWSKTSPMLGQSEVQGDERDDEEEAAPGDPPHAPPTLRHCLGPGSHGRDYGAAGCAGGSGELLQHDLHGGGHRQGQERPMTPKTAPKKRTTTKDRNGCRSIAFWKTFGVITEFSSCW